MLNRLWTEYKQSISRLLVSGTKIASESHKHSNHPNHLFCEVEDPTQSAKYLKKNLDSSKYDVIIPSIVGASGALTVLYFMVYEYNYVKDNQDKN